MTDMTATLRLQHYNLPAMDRAHHHFMALLGTLPMVSKTALPCLLNSLILNAREHFDQEERFMQVTGYPGYESHRQQHQALLKILDDYHQELQHQTPLDALTLHSQLCLWQDEHQQGWDGPLADYLRFTQNWQPREQVVLDLAVAGGC
ncbi:bacteriohemerythrin [Nitrincola alkalisediminis]|uniref:bacteriohemerythrin n=1 Tax=Nitrincola alkalisediminis TaxID=1366656 RepID=UPI00187404FA|nr:hemerythrin family protein [Nitrincola alkalisediminis]